jgi:hypothetical protein
LNIQYVFSSFKYFYGVPGGAVIASTGTRQRFDRQMEALGSLSNWHVNRYHQIFGVPAIG